MTAPLLEADRIVKRFPGVTALDGVSLDLRPGEVHALCGENGAGKSTLIKLLSGQHAHGTYEGELRLDGHPLRLRGVGDARRAGIAVIPQELALADDLSVAENLFLGEEPVTRLGLIDHPRMLRDAAALLRAFEIDLDPASPVGRLGVGLRQMLEIAKAAGRECRVLILDEPTAALAPHETDLLLNRLRALRARGIGCIYISHRLEEVFAIADRITVLRDGRTVSTHPTAETSATRVIRDMVGRDIAELYPPSTPVPGPERLRVENLTVAGSDDGRPVLEGLSFAVHAGETLGIGGLLGAGRSELLLHLAGAWGRRASGSVWLDGREIDIPSPAAALKAGIALVPEDRRRQGLVLGEGVGFNLSLSSLHRFCRAGWIDRDQEAAANRAYVEQVQVKATGLDAEVGRLSGGNQQKVVLGKALMTEPRVILLDEPTRGIDVGAKQEVAALIRSLTARGLAVLLVSSELPELLGLSDRLVVLHQGRIHGRFTRAEATPERVLAAAVGAAG